MAVMEWFLNQVKLSEITKLRPAAWAAEEANRFTISL